MVMKNLKSGRRLAVLALFAILAMSAFGFAASNTVPDHRAGYGDGVISGYDISDITYTLNGTDMNVVDEVSFTLDQAATTVQIQFDSPSTIWACDESGTAITCDVSGGTVLLEDIESLAVAALE